MSFFSNPIVLCCLIAAGIILILIVAVIVCCKVGSDKEREELKSLSEEIEGDFSGDEEVSTVGEDNIENVQKYGTSITCSPCFETPIVSSNGETVDSVLQRNTIYTAKAPQCFILDEILDAHDKVRSTSLGYNDKKIVDSCSLFMSIGKEVHLTEGNRENIKVTTVEDYINLLASLSIEDQKQIFLLQEQEEKR